VGAVATGDALVTGHPITGVRGPHLLPDFFTHDAEQAERSSTTSLKLDAGTSCPATATCGRGEMREAVAIARAC
jgi:hypothetical protein